MLTLCSPELLQNNVLYLVQRRLEQRSGWKKGWQKETLNGKGCGEDHWCNNLSSTKGFTFMPSSQEEITKAPIFPHIWDFCLVERAKTLLRSSSVILKQWPKSSEPHCLHLLYRELEQIILQAPLCPGVFSFYERVLSLAQICPGDKIPKGQIHWLNIWNAQLTNHRLKFKEVSFSNIPVLIQYLFSLI